MLSRLLLPLALIAVLAGCSTERDVQPPDTATEELLVSSAADRMVDKLQPAIAPGTPIFVDAQYFEGFDSKYTISAIRDRLARAGGRIVADRKDASMVVELRAGAHAIDQNSLLIGIPAIPVPIPLTGTLSTPEVALFKRANEHGIVKVAMTGYDAKTGALDFSVPPTYGESKRDKWTVLIFFSWTSQDILPEDPQATVTQVTGRDDLNKAK